MVQIGEILGGMYQITKEIGHGGTGIIYLAEHLRLCKTVIVKKIMEQFTGRLNDRIEVDILKNLHHTYLPQVYDFFVIDQCVYTVMEYIEGHDLQYYLDRNYFFPEGLIREWMMQLTEVLQYLHSRKPPILHSDIKPGNIMITKDNSICLIDFNIAIDGVNSKTVQGLSAGYAAPEQKEQAEAFRYGQKTNIQLDGRMDIYSTGAVFYRMMTGCLLSETLIDIMDVELPNYSAALKMIVSKASQSNPSARFQTADQMHKALEHLVKMDPVYKKAERIQVGSILVWLLCMLVGAACVYYGNWQKIMQEFNKDYRELLLYEQNESETDVCSHGIEMLNDFSYRSYLEKNDEEKAKLLHIIGESYFRQRNYVEAESYYEEAWNENPESGIYCRDYVIALVRNGKLSKARSVMLSVESLDKLTEPEKFLIQAEIAWINQDVETVLADIWKLMEVKHMADIETLKNGYLLAADAYSETKDYVQAVEMLEKASELDFSNQIIRELGQTAAQAAQIQTTDAEKEKYLKKAMNCYELLCERQPGFNDRLNLALTQRALHQYVESNRSLKELLLEYPQDYRIVMWICYNYLDIGRKEGTYQNIKEDLEKYYKEAQYLYGTNAEEDADMQVLQEAMKKIQR